jgi:hypothetical protein
MISENPLDSPVGTRYVCLPKIDRTIHDQHGRNGVAEQGEKRTTRPAAAARTARTVGRAERVARPAVAMRSVAGTAPAERAKVGATATARVATPLTRQRPAKPAMKLVRTGAAKPVPKAAGNAPAKAKGPVQKAVARSRRLAVPAKKAAKGAALGRGAQRKTAGRAGLHAAPVRTVKIKELNAQGKCGPGTSVVHLFRVDEVQNGTPAVHLVFFDRHGWYCEHGRSCHAVDDVRKLAGSHVARTYSVG